MADGIVSVWLLLPPACLMMLANTVRPAMSTNVMLYLPFACWVNCTVTIPVSTGLGDTRMDGLPFTATADGLNTTLNLLVAGIVFVSSGLNKRKQQKIQEKMEKYL